MLSPSGQKCAALIMDYRHCKSHLLNGLEEFILVGIAGLHRLIQLLRSQDIE